MNKFQVEKSYGRILGVAYTYVFRQLALHMKEKNLPITPDQFRVLTHLWKNDGCSQQELATGTLRDRANVTRIIDIFEREGIVERVDHESDRRIFKIQLTQKGKAIEKDAMACGKAAIDDALKGISKSDLEVCMKVLNKTIENLT
jgi:DNA-binding MarR family transcriptional regulator